MTAKMCIFDEDSSAAVFSCVESIVSEQVLCCSNQQYSTKLSCYFSKVYTNIYPCLCHLQDLPVMYQQHQAPKHSPSQHRASVGDLPWAHGAVTLLNGHVTLDPGVQCFLQEECPNLLTKQVDLSDTEVLLTQKASIFWGKECKIANALKIMSYFIQEKDCSQTATSNLWIKLHAFSLFWSLFMLPQQFPIYIREKR